MTILKNTQQNKCFKAINGILYNMQESTALYNGVEKFKPITTIFRNFKNQSTFYNHHVSQMSRK